LNYYCDKINFKIYSTVIFQVHENNQLKFDVLSKGFAYKYVVARGILGGKFTRNIYLSKTLRQKTSTFNQVIFMQAGHLE
jgi:hypothetical protein